MTVTDDKGLSAPEAEAEQAGWDRLVAAALPSVHPVDRAATRIWFSFWPLKLDRLLKETKDLEELVRDRRLEGRYRLAEQLDESVEYFHGRHFWGAVKQAIARRADAPASGEGRNLEETVKETAAEAARAADADVSLTLGITLAGFMAHRQLGRDGFRKWADSPLPSSRVEKPEAVLARRAKNRAGGWLSFLKTADRPHRVIFDETRRDGNFTAIHGQDLSMASANDKRDYASGDPRRLEGPVPFECRSGSCGFCWVGILGGADRLEPISAYEARRLRYFGYVAHDAPAETHPPIRLACQAQCKGDVTIVVPPWNGALRGRN